MCGLDKTYIVFYEDCIECLYKQQSKEFPAYIYENINGDFIFGRKAELLRNIWPIRDSGYFFELLRKEKVKSRIEKMIKDIFSQLTNNCVGPYVFVFPNSILRLYRAELQQTIRSLIKDFEIQSFAYFYLSSSVKNKKVVTKYIMHLYRGVEGAELILSKFEKNKLFVEKEIYFSDIQEEVLLIKAINKLCIELNINSRKDLSIFAKSKEKFSNNFKGIFKYFYEDNRKSFQIGHMITVEYGEGYKLLKHEIDLEKVITQLIEKLPSQRYKGIFLDILASFSYYSKDDKQILINILKQMIIKEEVIKQQELEKLRDLFLLKPLRTQKVGIVSPFTYGKSTVLNGLLGFPILKEAITAETAVVTYITYSPYFSLYYETENDIFSKRYDSFEEFREDIIKCSSVKVVSSDFQKIHITLPFAGLYKSIEWIDTPGFFGPHKHHDLITENALKEFDVIVFLIDPEQVGKEQYMDKLVRFRKELDAPFIFAVNKYDLHYQSINTVMEEVRRLFNPIFKNSPIVYISGYWAVKVKAYEKKLISIEELKRDRDMFLIDDDGMYYPSPLLEEHHLPKIYENSNIKILEQQINKFVRRLLRKEEIHG